jgi:hypothetical protein
METVEFILAAMKIVLPSGASAVVTIVVTVPLADVPLPKAAPIVMVAHAGAAQSHARMARSEMKRFIASVPENDDAAVVRWRC